MTPIMIRTTRIVRSGKKLLDNHKDLEYEEIIESLYGIMDVFPYDRNVGQLLGRGDTWQYAECFNEERTLLCNGQFE